MTLLVSLMEIIRTMLLDTIALFYVTIFLPFLSI